MLGEDEFWPAGQANTEQLPTLPSGAYCPLTQLTQGVWPLESLSELTAGHLEHGRSEEEVGATVCWDPAAHAVSA